MSNPNRSDLYTRSLYKTSDVLGKRFGRLTVRDVVRLAGRQHFYWKCECDCGKVSIIRSSAVRNGVTKSCKCSILAAALKHGQSNRRCKPATPEYTVWANLRSLKANLSERWNDFENFYADMGIRPPGHKLCRLDATKPYDKTNCYWARIRIVLDYGLDRSLRSLAQERGIPEHTIYARLRYYGWSLHDALNIPAGQKRPLS